MKSSDYSAVRIPSLRGQREFTFDLYIFVAEKFILYLRAGDPCDTERIERLHNKGQQNLYILKSQENEYRSLLRRNIDEAYSRSKHLAPEERVLTVHAAQLALVENFMQSPEDKHIRGVVSDSSKKYIDFILGESTALKTILEIKNHDSNLAQHAVATATLTISLCKHLGIKDAEVLSAATLDGFLRDVNGFKASHAEAELVSTCKNFDEYIGIKGIAIKDALKAILIDGMGVHPLKYLQALQNTLKEQDLI